MPLFSENQSVCTGVVIMADVAYRSPYFRFHKKSDAPVNAARCSTGYRDDPVSHKREEDEEDKTTILSLTIDDFSNPKLESWHNIVSQRNFVDDEEEEDKVADR